MTQLAVRHIMAAAGSASINIICEKVAFQVRHCYAASLQVPNESHQPGCSIVLTPELKGNFQMPGHWPASAMVEHCGCCACIQPTAVPVYSQAM